MADGAIDGVEGFVHVAGDLGRREAKAQAFKDFFADGGLAMELADAGALTLWDEGGGFGDFVAEEQAGGEMGDDLIPGVVFDGGEIGDVVAFAAGEDGGRRLGEIGVA